MGGRRGIKGGGRWLGIPQLLAALPSHHLPFPSRLPSPLLFLSSRRLFIVLSSFGSIVVVVVVVVGDGVETHTASDAQGEFLHF